jgi:hypothetical protein
MLAAAASFAASAAADASRRSRNSSPLLTCALRASTSPTLGDDWTALVLEARSRPNGLAPRDFAAANPTPRPETAYRH